MKKSFLAHFVSIVFGILGFVAFVGARLGDAKLYNDAIVLTLLSIASIACAIYYLKIERA